MFKSSVGGGGSFVEFYDTGDGYVGTGDVVTRTSDEYTTGGVTEVLLR